MKSLLTILTAVFLTAVVASDAWAPPVFSVPSGGRGLENAKQAAQITQIKAVNTTQQTSIDTLTTQMATVQPHAKATMNSCAAGNKILWDGTVWTCVSETDPTVQAFAKSPLPTCGAGQILKADGTNFSCVNSAAAGFEVDPTVYAFAKSTLPNCTGGTVLSGNGTALSCVSGTAGFSETDPTVTAFAKAALPNCTGGNVLTGNGTSLSCTNPAAGFSESDPVAKTFAKTTLPTCGAAQALTGNGTALSCTNISGAGVETDPVAKTFAKTTLPTCGAGQALKGDGTALSCVAMGGAGVETDPKIGTLTNTKWCTSDGTTVSCTQNAPLTSESDPKVGTVTSGYGCYGTGSAATCADSAFFWDATNHRLGVGTASPASKLSISGGGVQIATGGNGVFFAPGAGNAAGWNFNDSFLNAYTSNAERMRIDASGNVGIGTTGPTVQLDVVGTTPGQIRAKNSAGNARVDLDSAAGSYAQMVFYDGGAAKWYLRKNPTNTFSIYDGPTALDRLTIDTAGNVGIGTAGPAAKLDVNGSLTIRDRGDACCAQFAMMDNSKETHFYTYSGGDFQIHKYGAGSVGGAALTILNAGNVGIGTTSPGAKLDVSGTVAHNQNRIYLAGNGDTNHYIEMTNAILGNTMRLHELGSIYLDTPSVGIATTATSDGLTISKNWYDSSSTDFGGGLRLSGTAPSLSFYDTDETSQKYMIHNNSNNLNFYRRANGGGWSQMAYFDAASAFRIAGPVYLPYFYDADNTGFYVDLNNVSIFNDIRPSIIYDRDNTGYYVNPDGTSAFNVAYAWSYYHHSDARLKDNIKTIEGLELVKKLRGVTFDWKRDGKHAAGVIAQEVQKAMPYAVQAADDKTLSVDSDQMIAPMIEAIKELSAQNEQIRSENGKIRAELDELKHAKGN